MDQSGPASEELLAAIERVYAAFEPQVLKPDFELRCSPVGTRHGLARVLAATPLRTVGVNDLAVFAFKAPFTMGDADDFKHFLPRMLELHAVDPTWHTHETNVFSHVAGLGWRRWPPAEQQAIEGYFAALWRVVVAVHPGLLSVGAFLSDSQQLGLDVRPFLDAWRPADSAAHARRLAEFVCDYFSRPDALRDVAPQVEDWFVAHDVKGELERAFFRHAAQPFAQDLARAADWMHWRAR